MSVFEHVDILYPGKANNEAAGWGRDDVDEVEGLEQTAGSAVPSRTPRIRWLLKTLFWITTFICSGFTSVSSFALWIAILTWDEPNDPHFMTKLFVKGLLFGLLALVSFRWLRIQHGIWPSIHDPRETADSPVKMRQTWAAIACLVLIALVAIPFLGTYPHIEPDESHHLIVARNLAEFGVYGSGHPQAGFEWFDDYDSVGPPVIVPVAITLRFGDTNLLYGRLVMALYFVTLCIALYGIVVPLFGASAGIAAMLLATAALGSAYLARSLYGEVPALFFLVLGLLLWRESVNGRFAFLNALLAGCCFGFMILTKYFAVIAFWAFLGVLVYDRLTFRKLTLIHLLVPAVCASAILIGWLAIQNAYRPDGSDVTAGHLSMYKHNLMFGFDPLPRTLGFLVRHGVTVLVAIAAMIAAAPVVFYRRYDPAAAVLFFFAPFIAYWWVFFTTGNIPRYLWYAIVIVAVFTGPLAWLLVRGAWNSGKQTTRIACTLIAIPVLAPYAFNAWAELSGIYRRNDMADEYALTHYVESLPPHQELSTTFYPVERTLNFLAGRYVERIPAQPEAVANAPLVIVDAVSQEMLLNSVDTVERFGRYAVVKGKR
ncbi:MAG: glycosyltransferase family 39 protein [Candidatus Hydrogenedentes bacterium]|nr:glycosyltransferase family 39 protein [Candidatus Hydrogenedentota bacterium]